MQTGEPTGHKYCTYFDSAYLARGRVLIESLRRVGDRGTVYVLALDDAALAAVSQWTGLFVHAISLTEIEDAFPELLSAREGRTRMEYVFTLTPWLTRFVMEEAEEGTWVTYLDADMAFFSSTEPIYTHLVGGSVGIVEHRFTWEQHWRLKYGRFNVAWVGFRKDSDGTACLEWWSQRCLEWCSDEVSAGRFADQGYLDNFPQFFSGVVIVDAPGADLAPWNLRRHTVASDRGGQVLVDGEPLIFFHFHGLKHDAGRYSFKHVPYFARTTPAIREGIYRPYCMALESAIPLSDGSPVQMQRRQTFVSALQTGRAAALRWLGAVRGDFVDVPRP